MRPFIIILSTLLILSTSKKELNEETIPIETLLSLQEYSSPNFQSNFQEQYSGIFDSEECLPSKKDSKKILLEDYGISLDEDPDNNLRFIIGKCNPVLFVPGIYATKLMLTVNCKKLN